MAHTNKWIAAAFVIFLLCIGVGFGQSQFVEGTTIEVQVDGLRVRDAPSLEGSVLGVQQRGQLGVIVTSSATHSDGYWWWQVDFEEGPDGWAAEGTEATAFLWFADTTSDIRTGEDGAGAQQDCASFFTATYVCASSFLESRLDELHEYSLQRYHAAMATAFAYRGDRSAVQQHMASIEDPEILACAARSVGEGFSGAALFAEALEMAFVPQARCSPGIPISWLRNEIIRETLRVQAERETVEAALTSASTLPEPELRDVGRFGVLQALLESREDSAVLAIVSEMETERYSSISFAVASDKALEEGAVEVAVEYLDDIQDNSTHDGQVKQIALVFAEADNAQRALELLDRLREKGDNLKWAQIEVHALTGNADSALTVFEAIEDYSIFPRGVDALLTTLIEDERDLEALNVIRKLTDARHQRRAFGAFFDALISEERFADALSYAGLLDDEISGFVDQQYINAQRLVNLAEEARTEELLSLTLEFVSQADEDNSSSVPLGRVVDHLLEIGQPDVAIDLMNQLANTGEDDRYLARIFFRALAAHGEIELALSLEPYFSRDSEGYARTLRWAITNALRDGHYVTAERLAERAYEVSIQNLQGRSRVTAIAELAPLLLRIETLQ